MGSAGFIAKRLTRCGYEGMERVHTNGRNDWRSGRRRLNRGRRRMRSLDRRRNLKDGRDTRRRRDSLAPAEIKKRLEERRLVGLIALFASALDIDETAADGLVPGGEAGKGAAREGG